MAFFEAAPLPFAEDALEPWIARSTLALHYERHRRGYGELNRKALEDPTWHRPLVQLVCDIDPSEAPLAEHTWSHEFYWRGLRPGGGGRPAGALLACLEAAFGGFSGFRRRLADAAGSLPGSGWAWLALDQRERLCVTTSHEGGHPLRRGLSPLFALDLCEHAYVGDDRDARGRYVDAVLDHLIDWDFVFDNLACATGARAPRLRAGGTTT